MIEVVLVGLSIVSILPGIVFVFVKYDKWKKEKKNESLGFCDFYFIIIADPAKSPLLNKEKGKESPWIPYFVWFLFVNFVMIIYVSVLI